MSKLTAHGSKLTGHSSQLTAGALGLLLLLFFGGVAGAQSPPQEPLTLKRAVERALARAPEIAVAQAQANEAAAGARAAGSAFSPQAFARTTPGLASGLPVAVAGDVPAVFAVQVHQTIYDPARRSQALEEVARAAAAAAGPISSTSAVARALVLSYGRNWADQVSVAGARET